jgi:S-DNA-T family DNA segregation ATPase FtsK/SpoIIIE
MFTSKAAEAHQALIAAYSPEVQVQIHKITAKLAYLGFPAIFTRMIEGPVVRTFYFKPTEAFKFQQIFSKEEEIAGVLAVESVRISRELGECTIAVPRKDRELIQFDKCLHTMLTSTETAGMALPLLMGQSTQGEHLYADLSVQPHLLIAGATGSGKSIYTAQLICSLALFRNPEELEFTLVDTKNLDLVLFKTLTHVRYVLDNIEDLRVALKELLSEVRLRNEQMSGIARSIKEWNALGIGKSMKYKILVVDELADIIDADNNYILQFKRSERPPAIQGLLKQIAQISRAAGVHLVMATQRPSIKVTPGDFKVNLSARVCFKLPTKADSRVILDANGAENLLGLGDYLYKIAGSDTIRRAHSAFVSMNDIVTIIMQHDMIRKQYAYTN